MAMTGGPGDFATWLKAAEFHWHFVQGERALEEDLYVPGCVSLLCGIEASIRSTIHQIEGKSLDDELGATLSNPLLRKAREHGLPVEQLAFPDEEDFDSKLEAKRPYVEVVRVRHNLAHGNVVEYIDREMEFFTPECLRELAGTLLQLSRNWAQHLGEFRARKLKGS